MDTTRLQEVYRLERAFLALESERQAVVDLAKDAKPGSELRKQKDAEADAVAAKIAPLKLRWKELRSQYDVGDQHVQREVNNAVQKLRPEELAALVAVLGQ